MVESIASSAKPLGFFFKGPISALCFHKAPNGKLRLLVCEGPVLSVYDLETRSKLLEQALFPSCFKVTEIKVIPGPSGERILLNTETQVVILDREYMVTQTFSKKALDKIVHTTLNSEGSLVNVYAHNFVEVWSTGGELLARRHFCEEECILYSADYNDQKGLVASGTVFRTILLWRLEEGQERCPVMMKLEGHEGVIFDVKFLKEDLIGSVSDDRSLRLWKPDLENLTYHQVAQFFGHKSRVWKLRELGYHDMLVTVSEDTTCKVWETVNLTEQEPSLSVNRSIETLKGHLGKNIRGLACFEGIIATGGDDGAVKVWDGREIVAKKLL